MRARLSSSWRRRRLRRSVGGTLDPGAGQRRLLLQHRPVESVVVLKFEGKKFSQLST